ncbi:MAG: glycosyltransferase [Eubacteriales bacterium]|nr:glycosyltransferase [Eubacteriales bacterium]
MKYLKFMPKNRIDDASRNKRELIAAKEFGYDCYCYCDPSNGAIQENFPDFSLIVLNSRKPTLDQFVLKRYLIIINNALVHMKELRQIDADIISCHNIYALGIAYFAYLFHNNKPKFIYDSHEFELKKKPRNKIMYHFIKALEGYLIKKCAFTIMVNEYIADAVAKIHGFDYPRAIVRSTPNYWKLDSTVSADMHAELCEKLGVPKDSFLISYHGNIFHNRGVEEIYRAMKLNPNIYLISIGNYANERYQNELNDLAEELAISNRIVHIPAQPHSELWKYVSAVDCGIVMFNGKSKNYAVALPNKFFENIQSMTPIICSDSVEMARIVNQYDIGILSPSGDAEKLAGNIERMRTDKELYRKFKANLTKAKNELCWENEKKKLLEAYKKYL